MNASEISSMLAKDATNIAAYLLPNGKKQSGEWKVGSVNGEVGQSLSVRLTGAKAGVWKDFSSGECGDLLDLWASTRGLSIAEALTEARQFLGVKQTKADVPEKRFNRPQKPVCKVPVNRVKEWLNSRGLTDETIAAFKVGEQSKNGKVYAVFPYMREGELINCKYRNPDEKKDMRQDGGSEPCLFGWHLIDPKQRTIAICEGEIDAMTMHQMGIPTLSVNAGATNHQWLEQDYQRLERFSEILVAFDNDEKGNEGALEVIRRLGDDRCKRFIFPAKDANEYLMQGAERYDFLEAVKSAKPIDPPELIQIADFMAEVKDSFYPSSEGPAIPCLRFDMDYRFFEFRHGELSVWTGYNGHGKSLMLSQILLGLAQQGERMCIFSGEMTPKSQLKRFAKQASGLDRPSSAYLDAIERWMRDKFWVFNIVGNASLDRLLEVFLLANRRYDIRHFVIDSLMMTDVPEDGAGSMTAQKQAIQKLAFFTRRHNVHIHLVAHPRKAQDESRGPGKLDVAGSSKITDGADNVFTVWSARKDESEPTTTEHDAKLTLQKQRHGDVQHKELKLWFCKEAQQFVSNYKRIAKPYVQYSNQDNGSVAWVEQAESF